ncbi:MAG: hypothetical protein JNL60_01205 [Bacteroidia bacterium]|nr:hypothetical protein [Bacteroidia bacterium]
MLKIFLIGFLAAFSFTLKSTETNKPKTTKTEAIESEPSKLVVKSILGFQRGEEYIFQVVPTLYWDKVSYYILDKNRSVLGGGTLASSSNTIILSKYPKGEYSICLRTKGAFTTTRFVIN